LFAGGLLGIRRAYFFVWPWKKIELEKMDVGA